MSKKKRPKGRPRLPESERGFLIQSIDIVRRRRAREYQCQYRENKTKR